MVKYSAKSILIDEKNMFEIEVKGHAHYAPKGQDIVCASVSSLCWFLSETLMRFKCEIRELTVNEGHFKIQVQISRTVGSIINAFLSCMDNLACQYPQHVERVD